VLDTQLNVSRSHLPRAIPTLHALTTINYCYLMLKLVWVLASQLWLAWGRVYGKVTFI